MSYKYYLEIYLKLDITTSFIYIVALYKAIYPKQQISTVWLFILS